MDRDNDQLNFHIALCSPEIPANTGNIGRLCVGSNSKLHLIKPLRFFLTDKHLKRAGLDYWNDLELEFHESFELFLAKHQNQRIYLCSTKGKKIYSNVSYKKGDVFVFGPETKGLPVDILEQYAEYTLQIPMCDKIRSINLANSVAIILYEAWRQISFK